MFGINKEVKDEVKILKVITAVVWIAGLVALTFVANAFMWPWYIGMVSGFAWSFLVLVFEGQVEDSILVRAYGPDKRAPRE